MDARELIAVIAAAIVGLVWGFIEIRKWRREKAAQERGLPPNPTRCEGHEVRLVKLEENLKFIREELSEIKSAIHRIEDKIK